MDQTIITELARELESNIKIHAMWIRGSVAEGYADELSDIDIMIVTDEGCDDEVYASIESFLRSKDKLAVNFDARESFSNHSHKVYRLEQADPYHFIEVTLLPHINKLEFTEGLHKVEILFDKNNIIHYKSLDKKELDDELRERNRYLKEKIELGELSVAKEIIRGQFLEAMHSYQFWMVEPILELARIKYSPLKISYGLKHASRDLPRVVVTEIESLYKITSLEDLRGKIEEVKVLVGKYGISN